MDEFEQQIENAALQLIGGPIDEQSCMEHDEKLIYQYFKLGAKSDASKAFYQQGRYTEDQVKLLLLAYNLDCITQHEHLTTSVWFEQNKKK